MASIIQNGDERDHGLGDSDIVKSEDDVAGQQSSSHFTNEAFKTATDSETPPVAFDGLLKTVTDPLKPQASADALQKIVVEPVTPPDSTDTGRIRASEQTATNTPIPTALIDGLGKTDDCPTTTTPLPLASTDGSEKTSAEPAKPPAFALSFNREILESLFSFCSAKDLAKFRYVSKEWNEAAIRAWREEAQVTIVNYQGKPRKEYYRKLLPLNDLIRRSDPNGIKDSMKLNFECYHFHKYKLEGWYITKNDPRMVLFWGNLGPSITQLYLYDLRIQNMDTILEILYGKVPNMKTLTLEKIFVKVNEHSIQAKRYAALPDHEKLDVLKVRNLRYFPMDWREFFGHFPKIKSLESVSITNDATLRAMLRSILSVRLVKDVPKLKSLAIIRADQRHRCVQQPFTNEMMDLLFALRDVHLEEFNLKLGCRTTITVARIILETFADSLRKLTFHVDFLCGNQRHRFPYLINFPLLEELYLFQWCPPETRLHQLFKQMPNLKLLKIDGARKIFNGPLSFYEKSLKVAEDEKEAKTLFFCTSLEELSVSSVICRSDLTPVKLNYLKTLAPNLTKLELKMDDQIFRVVCRSYPNLIEMRVGGTDLTDAGLCGMEVKEMEKKENICDLKKLRVFVLNSLVHELTDVSIFNGFLKVPKLFTLQMSLPEEQISREARQALEEGISNLVVQRSLEGKKVEKQNQSK